MPSVSDGPTFLLTARSKYTPSEVTAGGGMTVTLEEHLLMSIEPTMSTSTHLQQAKPLSSPAAAQE